MDKLHVDLKEAAAKLDAMWRKVEADAEAGRLRDEALSPQLVKDIRASVNSKYKTYAYVLPTQLLAKLTEPKTDARSLQAKDRRRGAFDARSLCHKVVVPFDKAHENVLGGSPEPYANNPLRVPSLTRKHRDAQKDQDGWDRLCRVVAAVEKARGPRDVERFLRQVLVEVYRRLEGTRVTYPVPKRVSLAKAMTMVSDFLAERSGGDRLLAVVAALLETVRTETGMFGEIKRAKATTADSAAGMVADIECYGRNGKLLLAVEVKDRELQLVHVQAKLRSARAEGITELLFVVQSSVAAASGTAIAELADREFVSGHNVYVLDFPKLAEGLLSLIGEKGRGSFLRHVGNSLDGYSLSVVHRRRWAELLSGV